jgi:nucleoside 2-deoxyribosyltransferase
MKFYLAARYSRRKELCERRDLLRTLGHEVTSRWLDGDYPADPSGRSLVAPDEVRARVAAEDMADVLAADLFVAFTEEGRTDGRGGRHVELGIALAAKKRVIVVGPAENVFCCHPRVERFDTWPEFLDRWSPIYPGAITSGARSAWARLLGWAGGGGS